MARGFDQSSSILNSQSVSSKKLKPAVTHTIKKGTKVIVQPFKRAKRALFTHSSHSLIASSLPASDDGNGGDNNNGEKSVQASASRAEDETDPGKQLGAPFILNIATSILNSVIFRGSQEDLALSYIYLLQN